MVDISNISYKPRTFQASDLLFIVRFQTMLPIIYFWFRFFKNISLVSSDVIGKQMEILLYDPLHRWSWNCESSTPLFVRFAGGCNHRISDAFFDGLIKQFLQTWRRWDTHQSSTCAPTWKSGVLIVLCRNSLIMVLCYKLPSCQIYQRNSLNLYRYPSEFIYPWQVLCYKYHGVQKVNIFIIGFLSGHKGCSLYN